MPSTSVTAKRITWSATRKNTAASAENTNTIAVVIAVSRRDGQVTLLVSWRTSWKNLNGFTAMWCPTFSVLNAKRNCVRRFVCPILLKDETDERTLFGNVSPRKSVTGPLASAASYCGPPPTSTWEARLVAFPAHLKTSYRPDLRWQEWRDSNPQPPVLETGALAS